MENKKMTMDLTLKSLSDAKRALTRAGLVDHQMAFMYSAEGKGESHTILSLVAGQWLSIEMAVEVARDMEGRSDLYIQTAIDLEIDIESEVQGEWEEVQGEWEDYRGEWDDYGFDSQLDDFNCGDGDGEYDDRNQALWTDGVCPY